MSQKRKKILLTRRWPTDAEANIGALGEVTLNERDIPLSGAELSEALQTFDVICPTVTDAFTADVIAAGGDVRTRLLANFGVGVNHIDLAAATAAGLRITNTPGVLTEATAEIALTLLLMSARRTGEGERQVRAGQWQGWRPTHMLSTQVTGKTLGIVGMGRIGIALARKAHHGLGMRILYCNRQPVAESVAMELAAEFLPLEQLLGRADFVSLNCPATAETYHLLNKQTLALMPRHAHLINTARGDIVDEVALAEALADGALAGAGLDVFAAEPQVPEALLQLEQVVLLPHMGSGTVETRNAMATRAVQNVAAFLAGDACIDPVN